MPKHIFILINLSAKQRAKEAKQEFVNDNFDENSLTISNFEDNEHINVEYALGIYDEA